MIRRRRRGGALTVYLIATLDLPDTPVRTGEHLHSAQGWIGVDLGVENIAVTSDRPLARELMSTYGADDADGAAGRGSVNGPQRGVKRGSQSRTTAASLALQHQLVDRKL